ncbi:MAG: hypothetical protein EBR86_00935 [Planctomycetia bacterium]|nr:hypothetical protein [Planctomycetia bacterium]
MKLAADQLDDPFPTRGVVGAATVHRHQRLDAVAVGPHVVDEHRVVATDARQLLEEPRLPALDRPGDLGRAVVLLDERLHAHRRGRGPEAVVRPDARDDVEVLGALGRAERAVLVLHRHEESSAPVDGRVELRRRQGLGRVGARGTDPAGRWLGDGRPGGGPRFVGAGAHGPRRHQHKQKALHLHRPVLPGVP